MLPTSVTWGSVTWGSECLLSEPSNVESTTSTASGMSGKGGSPIGDDVAS